MLIDLYSAVIGGIIGGLVGFMTCILMAIMPKGKKGPCKHPTEKCQNNCEDWANCNEWEA